VLHCVHFFFYFSLKFEFFDFLYFISCICYKFPIINLMKAASIDGPYGLLGEFPISPPRHTNLLSTSPIRLFRTVIQPSQSVRDLGVIVRSALTE